MLRSMHPLKKFREEKGLSPAAVAAAIGCNRSTIYRIENGQIEPSSEIMRRILVYTSGRVTPNDLILVKARTG
jgi:DNA-binding XRE family transcriptional regulator